MDSKSDLEKFKDYINDFNERFKVSNFWNEFIEKIKYSNRFFVDEDIERLLNILLMTTEIIRESTELYRARLLSPINYHDLKIIRNEHEGTDLLGLSESKMKSPPKGYASSGRANPAGISYLYLASNPQTACAEVRPILIDLISVMSFVIREDIKVVNLVSVEKEDKSAEEFAFIEKVMTAFMLPIREQIDLEYTPTQFIASYFQNKGVDGIKYGTFNDNNPNSFNLVLFDENKVIGSEKNSGHGDVYKVVYKEMKFQNISELSDESVTTKVGGELLNSNDINKLTHRLEFFKNKHK